MIRQQERTVYPDACRQEKMVVLPLCPSSDRLFETGVYQHFMKNFRALPATAAEIRVLTSIQAAAAGMRVNPALAAKTLVDMGLRAPHAAFPASYLAWRDDPSLLSSSLRTDHRRQHEGA